jgi:pyruvate,water dikinase
MTKKLPYILFFKDISKHDIPAVGGKGANLGEMTQASFPVPPGFAVTVAAYDRFLEENGLLQEISDILKDVDVDDSENLESAGRRIRQKILRGKIPQDIVTEVARSYKKISGLFGQLYVAVRSSATAEDLPGMSFAGQQATFLNVRGESNLLVNIRECWASLFTERAIFYRQQQHIPHDKVKISVIVQKMVQSEVSGVMFTVNPVTNDKEQVIIEAVWGLGEMMVQGSVVPDHYVVQKDTFSILSKEVSDQKIQLTKKRYC